METVELFHFGDQCAPGIIIDDILKQRKKCLFMLGFYNFNDIYKYLTDNTYEKIYDKDYLTINKDNIVSHSYYNFRFNHDYHITDGLINNYDKVKERFNLKISNFREIMTNKTMCIFITFTANVNELLISNMIDFIASQKSNFHIMIFTDNNYNLSYRSPHLTISRLEQSYDMWYTMETTKKRSLYKEIYTTFIANLESADIAHHFPKTFEETGYI